LLASCRRNLVRRLRSADHGCAGKPGKRDGESGKAQREGGVIDLAAEGDYD
jgi:hypothetical protein